MIRLVLRAGRSANPYTAVLLGSPRGLALAIACSLALGGCFLLDRGADWAPGSVQGRVTFNGAAASGVSVQIVGVLSSARSGADGSFRLGGLAVGSYALRAQQDTDGDGVFDRGASQRFTVRGGPDGAPAGVSLGDVALHGAVELSGLVTDSAGVAAANVDVYGLRPELDETVEQVARTDAGGAFVLRGVFAGRVKVVALDASGTAALTAIDVDGSANLDLGTLVLEAAAAPTQITATAFPAGVGARFRAVALGAPASAPGVDEAVDVFAVADPGRYDVWFTVDGEVRGFLGDQLAVPAQDTVFGPAVLSDAPCLPDCGAGEGEGEGEGELNARPVLVTPPQWVVVGPSTETVLQFVASDAEGDPVTFSLQAPLPTLVDATITPGGELHTTPFLVGRGGFDAITVVVDDGDPVAHSTAYTVPLYVADDVYLTGEWLNGGPGPTDVALIADTAGPVAISGVFEVGSLHLAPSAEVIVSGALSVHGDLSGGRVTAISGATLCDAPPSGEGLVARTEIDLASGTARFADRCALDAVVVLGPAIVSGATRVVGPTTVQQLDVAGTLELRMPASDLRVDLDVTVGTVGSLTVTDGTVRLDGDLQLEGPAFVNTPGTLRFGLPDAPNGTVDANLVGLQLRNSTFGELVVGSGRVLNIQGTGAEEVHGHTLTVIEGSEVTVSAATLRFDNGILAAGGQVTGFGTSARVSGGNIAGLLTTDVIVDGNVTLLDGVRISGNVTTEAGATAALAPGALVQVMGDVTARGAFAFSEASKLEAANVAVDGGRLDVTAGGELVLQRASGNASLTVGAGAVFDPGPPGARTHRLTFASNGVLTSAAGTLDIADLRVAEGVTLTLTSVDLGVDDVELGPTSVLNDGGTPPRISGSCTRVGGGACP